MKILVVNAFFPPMTTGSAHFAFDVARRYSELGHEVAVLTNHHDSLQENDSEYPFVVYRIPARWMAPGRISFNYRLPFCTSLSSIKSIRRVFDEFKPDVLHQNGQFFDLTIWSTVLATRRRVPRVLTVHTPLTHTNQIPRILISVIDRLFLRLFANRGRNQIVGVDKFTIDILQRRYKPKRDVIFIPATLDVDAFNSGDPRHVVRNFGLEDKKVILSFGHVIPIRSRVPLVRALPLILTEIPNAQVLIVGEVYDTAFLTLAEELGVSHHITVVGRVPHEEVPDYLAAADIEVHDLDGHGIGITTFEVMAARVPIVASVDNEVFPGIDLTRWPEVRIHKSLTTSQLAQSVVGILKSKSDEIDSICDAQTAFIRENFSVDVVSQKYLDVFIELRQSY